MTTKKPSESYLRTMAYLSTPPADRDTKTVRVAPGEYILPPATVDSVGVPNLDRLVTETNGQPPGDGQSAAQRILAYSPELGRRSDEARLKQMSPAKRRLYEFDASQPRGHRRSEPLNLRELAAQASLPAFATGGLVTDDLKPRPVTGAPGVERTGNSYAQAAPTPAPAAAPKIETQAAWEGLSPGQRDQMLSGQNSPPARAGNVPGAPGVARSGNSYSQIAPTPGATTPNAGAGISQQDWERRPAAERDSLLGGGATGAQAPNATPSATGSAVSQLAWENMPSNKRDSMLNGNVIGAPGVTRTGNSYSQTPIANSLGQTQRQAESESSLQGASIANKNAATSATQQLISSSRNSTAQGPQPSLTGVSFSDMTSREPTINRAPGTASGPAQPYRSADNNAVPASFMERFAQLQSPNMGIKVTGSELAEPGRVMSGAPSAMKNLQTFDPAWARNATQQERDAVGDTYRNAWQQQAPGGLKGAGAGALALYNMEQATRGTGITAQRGANGTMEFSGNGANALPQSYTSGVNLGEANARMAQANAVRQSYLDSSGGPKGGVIDRPSSSEIFGGTRVGGRAARADRALALREQELAENRAARAQELQIRQQDSAANRSFRADEMSLRRQEIDQRQPLTAAQLESQQLQNQSARTSQARLAETDALIAEYGRTADPTRRAVLERQLRIRSGQTNQQQQDPNLKARADLIGELTKAYSNLQPNRNGPPLPSFEEWSAPMLQAAGLQAAAAQAKPLPVGMTQAGLIAQAQQGLRNGLSLEAVNRRLREFGIGPIGG